MPRHALTRAAVPAALLAALTAAQAAEPEIGAVVVTAKRIQEALAAERALTPGAVTLVDGEANYERKVANLGDNGVGHAAHAHAAQSAMVTETVMRTEGAVAYATETLVVQETVVDDRAAQMREARLKGYEGDSCGECGNFTLVRNGTCLKCDTCGGTTGCS